MTKKWVKGHSPLTGKKSFLAAIITLAFGLPGKVGTPPVPAAPPPLEIAAINQVVLEEMELQEIMGCAVGVVRNGQIVHVKGYGYQDMDQTMPVTENTIFRWASISKTLTAVAAFRAIEDLKLSLNDKVKDKLGYWPSTGDKGLITIRNLLNHRSGVPHYGNDGCLYKRFAYSAVNNFNAEQCVNVFKDCNLAFSPGTDYKYTTFGFNLLGAAIEKATGIPYENYIQDKIGAKASMSSLKPYANDPGGFAKDCNNKLKTVTEGNVEWKLPGGGWSSNIYDLTRFMHGLINGRFLANTAALWNRVPENEADNSDYCFGINRKILGSGRLHVFHGGTHNDVRTYLSFFPGDKTGVCVMINGADYVSRERLTKKIQNAIGYGWSVSDKAMEYCGDNTSCGEKMTGIWRKTAGGNVIVRRGYKNDNFYREWDGLRKLGYYCAGLDTYLDGAVRKWDGIFKKGSNPTLFVRDLKTDEFNAKAIQLNGSGYRLIDMEPYLDGTIRKWAGVFMKVTGNYQVALHMESDDFGTKHEQMAKVGYKLKDIESYMDGIKRKWAGIWLGSGEYRLNRGYSTSAFLQLRQERHTAGWKLVDAETYLDGLNRKWAGVWEKASGEERFVQDEACCKWLDYHSKYKEEEYELIGFSKF